MYDLDKIMDQEEHNQNTNSEMKVLEFRIGMLEKRHDELRGDISKIMEVLNRLDKKLNGIPESGLQCPIHQLRMDDIETRMKKVETTTENLTKKIISATAIASVILFLFGQIVLPYLLNHYHVTASEPVRVEDATAGFGLNFPTNTVNPRR